LGADGASGPVKEKKEKKRSSEEKKRNKKRRNGWVCRRVGGTFAENLFRRTPGRGRENEGFWKDSLEFEGEKQGSNIRWRCFPRDHKLGETAALGQSGHHGMGGDVITKEKKRNRGDRRLQRP